MRDLRKILDLVSSESIMDYCEEFDEIKSVLEHFNKHEKPFNKMHFRSGNQASINDLVNRLQQILINHGYVDDTKEIKMPLEEANGKLRKIIMFLIANTDATYKYNLRTDAKFTHIVEVCPLIPKFLLVAIMWDLELDDLFCEMLSYAPSWFTFQYFEVCVDSLKYLEDPYDLLKKVEKLLIAIFSTVTLMELRHIDAIDKRIICGKLYDATINLLRHVYTPDADKYKGFSTKKKMCFYGYTMHHLLRATLFFFDAYEKPQSVMPTLNDFNGIYDMCIDQCPIEVKNYNNIITTSVTLKEHQHKLINSLQNAVQYNTMLVDLNCFCYWSEVNIEKGLTLQRSIAEMTYILGERMHRNNALSHDMWTQLQIIAQKPLTLEDIVKAATIGDILIALDDMLLHEEKLLWFKELINRDAVLGNEECLQNIEANKHLITIETSKKMLSYLQQRILLLAEMHMNDEETTTATEIAATDGDVAIDMNLMEEDVKLIEIILFSLDNFKSTELIELLQYEYELFGFNKNKLFDQSPKEFMQQVTMYINKHNTVDKFDLTEFLKLTFQNPYLVWKQLFNYACSRAESLKIFCHALEKTKTVTSAFLPVLLEESIHNGKDLHQQLHAQLLCEIYFLVYNPYNRVDFLELCVHSNIFSLLEQQKHDTLLSLLLTLKNIVKYGETQSHKPQNLGEQTAPVLYSVALIMDSVRWDISNYTEKRHELLCECIDFVRYTNKHFLPLATKIDRTWITQTFQDMFDLHTQFYFQKYALAPDELQKDFDKFILPQDIETDKERDEKIIQEMMRCTKKETDWLAQSERFMPYMCDAMLKLSVAMQNESKRMQALNNYRRCFANFSSIAKTILIPKILEDNKKLLEFLFKILNIISKIPEEILAETFLSVLWLPLEIVEMHLKEIDFDLYKRIITFMDKINNCKAKELFCEKLESSISK